MQTPIAQLSLATSEPAPADSRSNGAYPVAMRMAPAMSSQPEFWSSSQWLWLAAAGPITLVPLVCFNAAARHLPYTTLGFLQYIAPTLVMLQAIFLFGEHFDPAKLVAFAFIWAGLAVYSLDIWLSLRKRPTE